MSLASAPALRPREIPSTALRVLAVAVLAAFALVASLTGPVTPGSAWARTGAGVLDPGLPTAGDALQRVVVSGVTGGTEAVRAAVDAVGGVVERSLPIVDGVAAKVPAERLGDVANARGVKAVTANRTAKVNSISWDESVSASSFVHTSNIDDAWAAGAKGGGVGIAVLDTGIAGHPDFAGRLVAGPDLSGENAPAKDSYGHGTVMAGIAGGSGVDAGSYPRTGAAPDSLLVSVKVAGANGATDVSTVLAAMHWVSAFKDAYKIRVLNLSWGVPSTQDPTVDPLNYTVQRLWRQGIVVVVAAGNDGPQSGTIRKPADDPVVLTVGAYDDRNDTSLTNDVVPQWSSRGPTAQGVGKPDLVAPGRTLISTRAAGSTVEKNFPKALVSPSYIKGSGTSQAAAVVSGAAAALLSARPGLTPDQVKAALRRSANPIPNVPATDQGTGRLDLAKALTVDVSSAPVQATTAAGTGSLDASRGSMARVTITCDGVAKTLNDETTSWCWRWSGASWTGASWTGASWTGASWTGASWTDASWSGASWTGASWTGASWTGASWTGASWTGASWTSDAWTGASWTGASWTGASWTGASWTTSEYGDEFTTGFYGDDDPLFMTAFFGPRPPADVVLPGEINEAQFAALCRTRPGACAG